ncbi:Gfo/Idh/MocA family protein [Streptomyces afghaniensis]|uniref:Gfo/Idh/MocA family protein n=1 Tax=Streptomyces afghaniensis TaxID=66865 RepID=UPI0037A0C446
MTRSRLPRVLLVGAGAMGSNHGRVLAESERCALVAVADPAERRGRGLAERFGAEWMPEVGDLSDVDAVVVAATTDQHRRIALEVLAHDVPLFVEKPLCTSPTGSREIVDTALRRGVPLMCGFVERFNPAVIEALARLESPSAVHMQRHSIYSPRMRAGVAWDLLVHDVDLALRLFGDVAPDVVHASVEYHSSEAERNGEDVAEAVLEFSGARMAVLSASRVASRRARRMIVSEGDRVVVADLLNPSVAVYRDCHIVERTDCRGRGEPLVVQLNRFIDILDGKADVRAEACSILPSHEAVAAILDSAAGRAETGARLSLNPPM